MPFFSIYEPVSGPLHYYTVTLIGYTHGLVVRWVRRKNGWRPQVLPLCSIPEFTGSRLEGYRLTDPESIDTFALEAMTGQKQSWP